MKKSSRCNTYIVDGKEVDILKQDWDILIILDACRYDMFKEVYKKYFNNYELKKAISPATWTMEWFNKIFGDRFFDEIIYISANWFINPIGEVSFKNRCSGRQSFDGRKHFFRVLNSKDIHPLSINKIFHKAYLRYPNKRFILHYWQPHRPYITVGDNIKLKEEAKKTSPFHYLKALIPTFCIWKAKRLLKVSPTLKIEKIFFEKGREGVIDVYKKEIELALRCIKILVDSINVNWLITSDHGERFYHPILWDHGGRRDKEVTEVPWLEIKKRSE